MFKTRLHRCECCSGEQVAARPEIAHLARFLDELLHRAYPEEEQVQVIPTIESVTELLQPRFRIHTILYP